MATIEIQTITAPALAKWFNRNVNCYVLHIGDKTLLIDSGEDSPENMEQLRAATGPETNTVWFTHLHPDHVGGALALRKTGKAIWAADPRDLPVNHNLSTRDIDQPLDALSELEFNGVTFQVIHTPGHAPGHVCFYLPERGALFCGDMIVGEGTVWVGPPHGDMLDYMDSLRRLRTLGAEVAYSGHGPAITDPTAKIDEYIEHREMRENQILEQLRTGETQVDAMVTRIYHDVDPRLHPPAGLTVRAHLAKLVAEHVVTETEEGFVLA